METAIDRPGRTRGWQWGAWAGRAALLAGLSALSSAALADSSPYPGLAITSSISNQINYSILGGASVVDNAAPGNVHIRVGATSGGNVSEIGLDLTSSLSGDNFSFLHNGYCVGTCTVGIKTVLDFSLTNTGDTPLDVRWDSLITPGHIAQLGSDGSALFHFIVVEGNELAGQSGVQHESRGETFGWYTDFALHGSGFAGFNGDTYSEGVGHLNARSYADWSATSLNFNLLTIPGHTTTVLSYISWVEMSNNALCTDLATCSGVQVAFGDPRRNGGTTSFASMLFSSSLPDAEPYIGRAFDAYVAPSSFVTPDTPLPPPPPVLPPVTYGATFTSQVAGVPEPGTWALLVLGFGAMGANLRRRARPAVALPSA